MVRISDCIDDMVAYTNLTDSVLDLIRLDPRPELAKAQELLKKIDKRQLYKCIGQTRPIGSVEIKVGINSCQCLLLS
jgi:hypothetical protein